MQSDPEETGKGKKSGADRRRVRGDRRESFAVDGEVKNF